MDGSDIRRPGSPKFLRSEPSFTFEQSIEMTLVTKTEVPADLTDRELSSHEATSCRFDADEANGFADALAKPFLKASRQVGRMNSNSVC